MGDDVAVGGEPGPARGRVAKKFVEDPDTRARGDDVRMEGELEQAAGLACCIELAAKNVEHVAGCEMRPRRSEAVHQEIGRIVTDPFEDRKSTRLNSSH